MAQAFFLFCTPSMNILEGKATNAQLMGLGFGVLNDDVTWNVEDEEATYYDMDYSELAKIIFSRIQKLEAENALKIMGCIFLRDPSNQELIQLALGPDDMLVSRISDAKSMLCMLSFKASNSDMQFGSYPPYGSRNLHDPILYWNPQLVSRQRSPHKDVVMDDYSFHNHTNLFGLKDQLDTVNQMENQYHPEVACGGGLTSRNSRRSHSLSELHSKACHYFNKGYCKHGTSCRYLHEQSFPDGYCQILIPNMISSANSDQSVTPRSLEKLEMEIVELLRSKKGPISIASLPTLYYERYGRHLQAEGYLTESQRHGKTGCNLTKLLANMKNSIRLIARPHGQHSIILVEDAPRFMEYRNERNDPGTLSSSSHQIYLTFPAESTFTVDDVSNYFSQYGAVQDVRIPCQDKRMFGFVSFVNPETVSTVLMKGNPHFIRGARVLVKPYREKSRTIDRTYTEKIKPPMIFYPNVQMNPYFHVVPRDPDNSKLLREKLIVEHEKMVEDKRTCHSEFSLASQALTQKPFLNYGTELKASGPIDFPIFGNCYGIDAINTGSTSDDKSRQTCNSCSDHESRQIELPESPFASTPV